MYTRGVRQGMLCMYTEMQALKSRFFRFQFPNDLQNPKVVTAFPGPKHLAALEHADATQQFDLGHEDAMRFIDLKASKGNFFKDVDGNVILDLNCRLPLGYNHDVLINARDSPHFDRWLSGKTDVGSVPPSDFAEILRTDVMPVAPPGHSQVHISDGSSTAANEAAMSAALANYTARTGKTSVCVMGFEGASHGDSVATLSVSDAAANVGGVPTFNWPVAPLPKMQYPLAVYEHENAAEEDRCITAAKNLISM